MNPTNRQPDCDGNLDPITKARGSHPVGTGVGGVAGAAGGAAVGALFGPIGMIVGGALGTIAGAAAGHGAAEAMDPTCENEYWSREHADQPYASATDNVDRDYLPAYRYGSTARTTYHDRHWDDGLEKDLSSSWERERGESTLAWNQAKPAVRSAWERADRTYSAYDDTDRYFKSRWEGADYRDPSYDFNDYRSAYRYGTYARSAYAGREWDDKLEQELRPGWERAKGASRLSWEKAKGAVRDAWHRIEHAMPGDADNDGR